MNFLHLLLVLRRWPVAAVGLLSAIGTVSARADVVFAWNEVLLHYSTASPEPIAPHMEARAGAMAHLAIHAAIESATTGADGPSRLAAQRAGVATAAHAMLTRLLPGAAKQCDALLARHLGAIPDGPGKTHGIAAGQAAAALITQRRDGDGWNELAVFAPSIGVTPDATSGTAAALAKGEKPAPSPWLSARPFVLKKAEQFPAEEPRTVSHSGIKVNDLLQHSRVFTAVDRAAAIASRESFWAQRPICSWNRIARQLSEARSLDLAGQARLLATLNVAIADATLAALHWRHAIGSWRVMDTEMWEAVDNGPPLSTDIVARVEGAPATEFVRRDVRRVLIPPLPNYPSLHASIAGAAQAALTGFFKADKITFTLPHASGAEPAGATNEDAPRVFASVSSAARECAFVASLDGRHCREACISGYTLGVEVGGYVGKRVKTLARR